MNKSWSEVFAALNEIVCSENENKNIEKKHYCNKSNSLRGLDCTDEGTTERKKARDALNEKLRRFLENEEDKFHPADVLLGPMPGFAIGYFPDTHVYRRRVRAYQNLYGPSKAKGDLDDGELHKPILTMEEYADQLIDSVRKRGGRFLRLDPLNQEVHVVDRGCAHKMILEFMSTSEMRSQRRIVKRTKALPNKFTRSGASGKPAKEIRKRSKPAADSKTKIFKAKNPRNAKPILKTTKSFNNSKVKTMQRARQVRVRFVNCLHVANSDVNDVSL